jgi:chromate transporter
MSGSDTAAIDAPSAARPSFGEATSVWLRIGLLSFGGPAGQIALMHRMLVEERGWIDERRFLHALNFCMLLPGPEAMQLATYVGWLLHGVRGGIVAGALFVLPGVAVMLGLAVAYAAFGDAPIAAGILFGLKAAVLAIVAEALLRLSRRALASPLMVGVAVAAFLAIAFLRLPFPLIVAAAGLFGLIAARVAPAALGRTGSSEPDIDPPAITSRASRVRSSVVAVLAWGGLWLVPIALLAALLGGGHVFVQEALFFSKTAIVSFGGAYAVLAYVAQQAVEVYHWLRPDEMLTGLGLAETTPGPLILVLVFVGFLGGMRGAPGIDPYLAGIIGGLVTVWVTFIPCFLWIFLGAPWIEKLRGNRSLSGALSAITAAVVGVVANLALWFGLHVLFAANADRRFGPLTVLVPDPQSFDPAAALIALAAGVALLRFHVGMLPVLGVAAAAGLALRLGSA